MAVRSPVVAGMFYEGDPMALRQQLERCFLGHLGPGRLPIVNPQGARAIVGLVCPHAGIMYSGCAAAHAYLHLAEDGPVDVAVILCPNHRGVGRRNAIWPEGAWETPLGLMPVAQEIASAIRIFCPLVQEDVLGHAAEHAIEVQLPFLQMLYGPAIALVPIAMKEYTLADSLAVGEAIARALAGRNAVVIASSDLSHYEPSQHARRQDAHVLEAIRRLDPRGLFDRVREHGITACGYGPMAAMLEAARRMGARQAEVLSYFTSGDVTGDDRQVVGYAAARATRG